MSATIKKVLISKDLEMVTVSDKVKNYANGPYFVEETKKAKAFLEKAGRPKTINKL